MKYFHLAILSSTLALVGCNEEEVNALKAQNDDLQKENVAHQEQNFVRQEQSKELEKEAENSYRGRPLPKGYPHQITIWEYNGFTVGFCKIRKTPVWVSYRLDPNPNEHSYERPSFRVDPNFRELSTLAYSKTGFDRGHMAPNYAIMTRYGRKAQVDTFYMTNVVPMHPSLNRGIWAGIEATIARQYANALERVWVVTGPIFDNNPERLPSGVEIPDSFYKIVVDELNSKPRALAIEMKNWAPTKNKDGYLVSVDSIEKKTGLDFFHDLEDSTEDQLESKKAIAFWTVGSGKGVDSNISFSSTPQKYPKKKAKNLEIESVIARAIKDSKVFDDIQGIALLEQLHLQQMGLKTLPDLSKLSNLTSLSLRGNAIEDLTPLLALKKLTYLHLGFNRIRELASLGELESIQRLYLDDNNVTDLEPLGRLRKLTELSLRDNEIKQLKPLESLAEIKSLHLGGNQLSDLRPLQTVTSIEKLYLGKNNVSDLTPLIALTNMTRLNLMENQVSDISPLSALKNLRHVDLRKNPIKDFTPLFTLQNLENLYLSDSVGEEVKSVLQRELPRCEIGYGN